jgi:hypothetical protein
VFGEDLDLDAVTLLLKAEVVAPAGTPTWGVTAISVGESELDVPDQPWEPAKLSEVAFTIVLLLCEGREARIDDASLQSYFAKQQTSAEQVVKELRQARLATVVDGRLELLTERCQTSVDPEIGYVAAEDTTGRFTRWMMKRVAARGRRG